MRVVASMLGLILCGTAGEARADDLEKSAEAMTFADVFKVAIRVAPQLQRAGFDVAHADAGVLSASAIEDWTLTMTGDYERSRVLSATRQPADIVGGSIGISRLLPTNGTIQLVGDTQSTDLIAAGLKSYTSTV